MAGGNAVSACTDNDVVSTPLMRDGMTRILSILMFAALMAACQSPSAPLVTAGASAAPAPPTSPAPPLSPSSTRFHVRGTMTDEGGSPLPGVILEVWFRPGTGGFSSHSLRCPAPGGCWVEVRTDNTGFYDVEFDAAVWSVGGVNAIAALVRTSGGQGGYEYQTQAVPFTHTDVVLNLRMRRPARISAGQSTTVSVDSDSTMCGDSEDLLVLHSRCAWVGITTDTPGTLVVEARSASGGITPTVYWATSGTVSGPITRTGPGTVSFPVDRGGIIALAGIPVGAPPQRFDVVTSIR
jgi:hypothetical protein